MAKKQEKDLKPVNNMLLVKLTDIYGHVKI